MQSSFRMVDLGTTLENKRVHSNNHGCFEALEWECTALQTFKPTKNNQAGPADLGELGAKFGLSVRKRVRPWL